MPYKKINMLHNKGKTIPYYGEDWSGDAFINRYSYTVQCHSIFLIFKKIL